MYKAFFLLFLGLGLLMGCKSDSSEPATTGGATGGGLVPQASVTLDGEVEEWAGLSPIVTDPAGDQIGTEGQDATHLFIRVSFSGTVSLAHQAGAESSFIHLPMDSFNAAGCEASGKNSGGMMIELTSDGINASTLLTTYDDAGTLTSLKTIAAASWGPELEIQVIKADLMAETNFLQISIDVNSITAGAHTRHDSISTTNCNSF